MQSALERAIDGAAMQPNRAEQSMQGIEKTAMRGIEKAARSAGITRALEVELAIIAQHRAVMLSAGFSHAAMMELNSPAMRDVARMREARNYGQLTVAIATQGR